MANTIFSKDYVIAMHKLVEDLTVISKFTAAEKRKLFCWLLDYYEDRSQKWTKDGPCPDDILDSIFQDVVLANQINIFQQALSRDLTQEKITARITIEFDIDGGTLRAKAVNAKELLLSIGVANDDTVDGFNINPAIAWCDITSDFFISNPRIVDRKFVKNEV